MAKFLSDLAIGNKGQQFFVDKLNDCNIEFELNKDNKFDISISYNGSNYTFEVKYDLMASKTGNIAIEYFNPKTNKPSGINSTQADFWVYVLKNPLQIYISPTIKLKQFIENTKPLKFIEKGGDNNASLLLYKKDVILDVCFENITDMKIEDYLSKD